MWLKRKGNATAHAQEAVCRKCKHGEWVRTKAFCRGRGKIRMLTEKEWNSTMPSFCPEYTPKETVQMGHQTTGGAVDA